MKSLLPRWEGGGLGSSFGFHPELGSSGLDDAYTQNLQLQGQGPVTTVASLAGNRAIYTPRYPVESTLLESYLPVISSWVSRLNTGTRSR